MAQKAFLILIAIVAMSCSNAETDPSVANEEARAPSKTDSAQITDIEWANDFFLTQIYDKRYNPTGPMTDTESNSCGPASLAMLMRERGAAPEGLTAQMAIDHARAMMYPGYPEIDGADLPEGAELYVDSGLVFVHDNARPVYFDLMEEDPSIPQGILHGGARPVFGYSMTELDTFLEENGSAIAHGHITDDWRARFSEDYGSFNPGPISHFIALFPASTAGEFVVCDPMHPGGAVVMTRSALQTFFKSPVNVYETTIRLVGWEEYTSEHTEDPEASSLHESADSN